MRHIIVNENNKESKAKKNARKDLYRFTST